MIMVFFAMKLCKNDLVLCCDATNSLDLKFLQIAVTHFQEDPLICSASDIIAFVFSRISFRILSALPLLSYISCVRSCTVIM